MLKLLLLNPNKYNFPKLSEEENFIIDECENIKNIDALNYDVIIFTENAEKEINSLVKRINFKFIPFILLKNNLDIKLESEIRFHLINKFPENEKELFFLLKKIKKIVEKANNFNYNAIKPFKEAIPEIFSKMAYLESELIESYIDSNVSNYGEITASLSLTGSRRGFLIITLNEKLARKIISRFVAIPENELTKSEVYDGAGEIINIIAGNAKARINDLKDHFDLSAPFVVSGENHEIYIQNDLPCVTMVYNVENEYFAFKVFLTSLKKQK